MLPRSTHVLYGSGLLLLVGVAFAAPAVIGGNEPVARVGRDTGTGSAKQSPAPQVKPTAAKEDKHEFSLAGAVSGLVPGVAKPMTVTVTNPNSWTMQVMSVTATVGSTGEANCPASALQVTPYTYTGGQGVVAPGKGSTTVTLSVVLADSLTVDTSGCPEATFPLTFAGTGEKAKS